jgi:hypothetical protein
VVLLKYLSADPYIMIAEIKPKFSTAVQDRVKPFWDVLNTMITPGISPTDLVYIDLLVTALMVFAIAVCVMKIHRSELSLAR